MSDLLDPHEHQYLQSCQWPPRRWMQAFFWVFLPAIGLATSATQWLRGVDEVGTLLTAAVFAVMAMMYFPLARLTTKPFSTEPLKWSGMALLQPSKDGKGVDAYIGHRRVVLPIGWDKRFGKMTGREVSAHGIRLYDRTRKLTETTPSNSKDAGSGSTGARMTGQTDRAVRLLSLNEQYWVRREMPAGLAELDDPEFYFGLALIPVLVMIGIALKIRFHMEYLLCFGLVSAGFALYGMHVQRRNKLIHDRIIQLYHHRRHTDKVEHESKS